VRSFLEIEAVDQLEDTFIDVLPAPEGESSCILMPSSVEPFGDISHVHVILASQGASLEDGVVDGYKS
jgi:hypothetical protein